VELERATRADRVIPDRPAAFASESELLRAARGFAGWTIAELARALPCGLPVGPMRDKGFVGRIVERSLGLVASPLPAADFAELGIELKTLPVTRGSQPRESTFVCYVALSRLAETSWDDSRVASKLARVLFVPIESEPLLELAQRRIGRAFLWTASAEQAAVLQADYAEIAGRVAAGHLETLDARVGRALQLRPKGSHGGMRVRVTDGEGTPALAQPRAFYLRASFTASLLRQSLRD
jgi:DNA mismatch repair protein MutH